MAEVDSTNEGVCNAGFTICSAHLDAVRQTVDCRVLPSERATALQSLFTNYSLAAVSGFLSAAPRSIVITRIMILIALVFLNSTLLLLRRRKMCNRYVL